MKIWHNSGTKEGLVYDIKVKDENNRFRITVYEEKDFIMSLGEDDPDIQEMSFTKDEMKEIYNFLKQYYE